MKYDINIIDPCKLFYVKDLYYLTSPEIKSLPVSDTVTKLCHKMKVISVGKLTELFNKPLHQCEVHELKFLWLMGMNKLKNEMPRMHLKSNIYKIFLIDFTDCILCYLSRLRLDYKDELIFNLLSPKYDILSEVGIYGLRDLKLLHGINNREIVSYEYNHRYAISNGKHTHTYEPFKHGFHQMSNCHRYRRPFLKEPANYPLVKVKNTSGFRLRDLMLVGAMNCDNNVLTFIDSNREVLGMTRFEYHAFMSKPLDKSKKEDLDKLELVLESRLIYKSYLKKFKIIKPSLMYEIESSN